MTEATRIAMVALQELEDNNMLDFLLIKDDKLREWWSRQKRRQTERKEPVSVNLDLPADWFNW